MNGIDMNNVCEVSAFMNDIGFMNDIDVNNVYEVSGFMNVIDQKSVCVLLANSVNIDKWYDVWCCFYLPCFCLIVSVNVSMLAWW